MNDFVAWSILIITPFVSVFLVGGVVYLILKAGSSKNNKIDGGKVADNKKEGKNGKVSIMLSVIGLLLSISPLFFFGLLCGVGGVVYGLSQFVVDKSVRNIPAIFGMVVGLIGVILSIITLRAWS